MTTAELTGRLPSLARWTAACAAAEALGLGAAAGAARWAQSTDPAAGLALIVAAGLVEGVALGAAQAGVLGRWLPRLRRGRYVAATVLVAGLGWAAASAPAALTVDDGAPGPSRLVLLVGGAALGLGMGVLLGAAQAVTMRGAVPRPRRWVLASTAAWPGAMAVIFVGASSPGETWSTGAVMLTGAVTGGLAGAVLGLVSWSFLPSLTAGGPQRVGRRPDPPRRLGTQLKRG